MIYSWGLRSASGGRSRQIGWTWPFASPDHGNRRESAIKFTGARFATTGPTSSSSVRASWRSWKFFITKSQPLPDFAAQLKPSLVIVISIHKKRRIICHISYPKMARFFGVEHGGTASGCYCSFAWFLLLILKGLWLFSSVWFQWHPWQRFSIWESDSHANWPGPITTDPRWKKSGIRAQTNHYPVNKHN